MERLNDRRFDGLAVLRGKDARGGEGRNTPSGGWTGAADGDAAFAVEASGTFGIVAKGIGQNLDLLDAMVRDVSSAKRYSFG